MSVPKLPDDFVQSIYGAESLLKAETKYDLCEKTIAEPLPSLLDQCFDLLEISRTHDAASSIRTVHHFACTGGTLISKCLASMPNVQLLSEVDPTSKMTLESENAFAPTDLALLAWKSTRGVDQSLLAEIFRAGLIRIHEDARRRGLRLVLRDHSHGRFCVGQRPERTMDLRELVGNHFEIRSVITVRHPLHSFLSLSENRWGHFLPFTIDEYAIRYSMFLDQYSDCAMVRYEDFVEAPEETMREICRLLDIPFEPSFEEVFSGFQLSGDSGRSGPVISVRERRPVPENILAELEASVSWYKLCDRLGYASVAG